MNRFKRAIERLRAHGLIYAVHRKTGKVTSLSLEEYCALDLETLEQYRFTFNPEKAYAPRQVS
jgi:hypothetical protein